jgi:hypothetical protein
MHVKIVLTAGIRMYVVKTAQENQPSTVSFVNPVMITVLISFWKSVRPASEFLMSAMVVKHLENVPC